MKWSLTCVAILSALLLLAIPSAFAAEPSDQTVPRELNGTVGEEHADLTWFQPRQGSFLLENYSVYRGSGPEDMSLIGNVSSNLTAYHDGGLQSATTYFYYVTAWYNGTESAPSNALALTTSPEPVRDNLTSMGVVLAIVISAIALQVAIVAIWVLIRKGSK